MNCKACGYYKLSDYEIEREDGVFHESLRTNNGTEDFIAIEGNFGINCTGSSFFNETVHIYACPECGTLILKHWKVHQ